jgi:transposase
MRARRQPTNSSTNCSPRPAAPWPRSTASGPSGAARLLVEVGDITRFPTRAHFTSWNGTTPLDASSGEQVRHRLSRAGNRQINRALHIMAVVQLRNPTEGRA